MSKRFDPWLNTVQGQHYQQMMASHTATCNMLRDHIKAMEHKRHVMMEAWRANGKTDAAWSEIEVYDQAIDGQVKILRDMEGW
jgi:hypothetical protein